MEANHNTVVVNEKSHFNGQYEIASKNHSEAYFFSTAQPGVQIASAKEKNAYPGVQMHRTMAVLKDADFEHPLILDLLKVNSDQEANYDLPFYFIGQLINTDFEFEIKNPVAALGTANGYQHLYLEASGRTASENLKFSWLNNKVFHTLTSLTGSEDELLFTRIGADDPEFNLRRDAGFMIRRKQSSDTLFASIIETHGGYSPVSELSLNSKSSIVALKQFINDDLYTAIGIQHQNGNQKLFVLANQNADKSAKHELKINNKTYQWKGPFLFTDINE